MTLDGNIRFYFSIHTKNIRTQGEVLIALQIDNGIPQSWYDVKLRPDEKVEHGDWVVIFMLTIRFCPSNRLQKK